MPDFTLAKSLELTKKLSSKCLKSVPSNPKFCYKVELWSELDEKIPQCSVRKQISLLPVSVEDYVGAEDFVRYIDELVDFWI